MRILVTGANGFTAYYICKLLLEKGYTVIATGKNESRLPFSPEHFIYEKMDLTRRHTIKPIFEKHRPDCIIHAAAMTQVDACEENRDEAYKVNVTGTENLLSEAGERTGRFIFLSTDFVFDGKNGMYRETDETGPVNYYGMTKLLAEKAVEKYAHEWVIARTCLVYGMPQGGKDNILTVVKRKLEAGERYRVVDDQWRTPTWVEDLAKGIVLVIEKRAKGYYHLSGKDLLTPYRMAIRAAAYLKRDSSLLEKVTEKNFLQAAKRPLRTGFNIEKAKKELGFDPVSFEEGMKKTFM